MWIRFIPGKLFQILKRTPVLYEHRPTQFEVEFRAEETFLRMLVQSAQHWPHRHRCRNPLAKGKELVDTHANQENNEWFIGLSGKSSRYHFSHVEKLLSLTYGALHYLTASQP